MNAFLTALAMTAAIPATPIDTPQWRQRHDSFLEVARTQGPQIQVLFLGDSITDYWRTEGRETWVSRIAPLGAANFGISGDRVEHVLWRIQNGELEGLAPKKLVLLIGTNNVVGYEVPPITATYKVLVSELRARLPETRFLLLAVFPRVDSWSDTFRHRIPPLNEDIRSIANETPNTEFVDLSATFRSADGSVPRDVMPDGLHLSAKGYRLWADALAPYLTGR